jgi:hypothetical protein
MLRPYERKRLGGGFGAKNTLEAGAGELDADQFFALGLRIANMNDAALRGEVRVVASDARRAIIIPGAHRAAIISGARGAVDAARSVLRKGDADLEVGTDGDVETGHEGGSVAAKIFAGSIFLEGEAVGVAPTHFERKAD